METLITQPDDYKHSKLVQKINALPEEALEQLSEYLDFLYFKYEKELTVSISENDLAELKRREEEYDADPSTAISLDQVITGLEKKLGVNLF